MNITTGAVSKRFRKMNDFPAFNPDIEVSSVGLRWEEYKMQFENYLVAKCVKKLSDIPKEIKLPILLHVVGTRVFQMYRTVADVNDDYTAVIGKLDKFFVKQVNSEYEKYKFSQAVQTRNENFDSFVSRLRLLAANCGFADTEAEIKSRVIQGCYSNELRVQALSKGNISTEDLLKLGRAIELSKIQSNSIVEERSNTISAVYSKKPISNNGQFSTNQKNFSNKNKNSQNFERRKIDCGYCGKNHMSGSKYCPAYGKKCNKCNNLNHFSTTCKRSDGSKKQETHRVASIEQNVKTEQSRTEDYVFSVNRGWSKLPTTNVSINGNDAIMMYIDTCCTMNVINEATYRKLKPQPKLCELKSQAFGYQNSTPLAFLGEFNAKIKCFSKEINVKIAVVNGEEKCLLGYEACNELGIVKIINSVKESRDLDRWREKYPNVFSGKLGKLKDFKVKFDVDESIEPICVQSRPVPFHMRERISSIIKKGIEDGIFQEAKGPTTWLLNPMVVPKDKDRVRFVIDASPVNVAIKRTKYVLPTIEDLITDLNGSTVFSKIDILDAFHQIELDEESRHLTTFKTHEGIYQYTRLVQGITSVPEIFHHTIQDRVVNGLIGTRGVFDDLLVHGKNDEDHDNNMDSLLSKLNDLGLTVNVQKCKFRQKSVEFFGVLFSAEGVSKINT